MTDAPTPDREPDDMVRAGGLIPATTKAVLDANLDHGEFSDLFRAWCDRLAFGDDRLDAADRDERAHAELMADLDAAEAAVDDAVARRDDLLERAETVEHVVDRREARERAAERAALHAEAKMVRTGVDRVLTGYRERRRSPSGADPWDPEDWVRALNVGDRGVRLRAERAGLDPETYIDHVADALDGREVWLDRFDADRWRETGDVADAFVHIYPDERASLAVAPRVNVRETVTPSPDAEAERAIADGGEVDRD